METITIGKYIVENLTTGMYADSKVAYREYIQNACDQIDKAIISGVLSENKAFVDIYVDKEKRYISIKDNATGVSVNEFRSSIGDIANSDKEQGKDKGFRGIGRLCGLAYCKILKFTSTAKGEDIASVVTYNAKRMREMLNDNKKYSVNEILNDIMEFETKKESSNEHYFNVEMFDINNENTELLNERKVIDYLSFVAPVPYKREFLLYDKIYEHAEKINYKIDEYAIYVNGSQVLKQYTTKLKEKSGNNLKNYDEIFKLEFKDFYNSKNELIAWMWVGVSTFDKQIPDENAMRGIRLRQSNIQIGGEEVFKEFFKEPRGHLYFVGEVFSVSNKLIANSQRNYFNENITRVEFEDMIRVYCYDVLARVYKKSNEIKNAYKKHVELVEKVSHFEDKVKNKSFIDKEDRLKLQLDLKEAKTKAEKAERTLANFSNSDVISSEAKDILLVVNEKLSTKFDQASLFGKSKTTNIDKVIEQNSANKKGSGYAVDALSKLNKNERKLVSKIWSIITNNVPKDIAEELIEKIKEEFK